MADFQPNKSYKKFFRNSSFKDVAYKGGNISDFTNDIGYSQVDTGSLVTTSSFNKFTSSYTTGSFTGSFNGTFEGNIENAVTASYALTAQTLLGSVESASYASTSSYSTTSVSSSYASSGNGTFSSSFSGSFQGDGSNITGISATPASGTVILLYSDETEDSGTSTTSNIKTYTVASNTYTKIMAECEVQLYGGDNVDCTMKYILSIGGDAVRELTLQQAATGRGGIWILAGNLKTSTSFTSGGTVSVSVNETSNGGTYYIQSLRVYGVI